MAFFPAVKDNHLSRFVAEKYLHGIATVFMLHRVEEVGYPKITPNEDLKVSPAYLEQVICQLKAKHYLFVSLDELWSVLAQRKTARKLVVFTLDDGYRDNLTHALPLFSALGVPFTVYIANSFPNRTAHLWWYGLEKIVRENQQVTLRNGDFFHCRTNQEKWNAFLNLRTAFLGGQLTPEELSTMTDFADTGNLCLNWEELARLSANPLVTIGAHTMSHPALSSLPETEMVAEMELSRRELEAKLNRKVEHFAYPFGEKGQAGQREFEAARTLGFKTAVTTRKGHIFPEHKDFLTALPRIYLYENGMRLDRQLFGNVLWNNKLRRAVTA